MRLLRAALLFIRRSAGSRRHLAIQDLPTPATIRRRKSPRLVPIDMGLGDRIPVAIELLRDFLKQQAFVAEPLHLLTD